MNGRRLVIGIAAALSVAACGGAADPVVAGPGGEEVPSTTAVTEGSSELALPSCLAVPPVASPPPVAGPLSDDPEVAAWQRRRAELGLASDAASTRAAADDPSRVDSYGFPMTPAEDAEFQAANMALGSLATDVQAQLAGEVWFGGTWIDNGNRNVTVAVTDDVAARQVDLDTRFGAGTTRAVGVARSEVELLAINDAVVDWYETQELRSMSGGALVTHNVVSVNLEILDPSLVADLAAAVGTDGICVDGTDPADVVPEGPQPQSGAGWRLLADEPGVGRPYATGFAGTAEELRALWVDVGLPGEPPAVDFATEVVLWFGPAVSGSCSDIRMEDVVIDAAAAVVRPEIVLPGGQRGCTDDARAHAYVVAVERSGLPDRFTVSIGPPNASCCPEGTTEVALR